MSEGGALLVNNEAYLERAEILREKGTNRSKFYRGEIDKYTWVDFGDSYLPSEINAAYLWGQFQMLDEINQDRLTTHRIYTEAFEPLVKKGFHVEYRAFLKDAATTRISFISSCATLNRGRSLSIT